MLAEAHRRGLVKTIKPDTRRLTEGEMAATLAALAEFRREYPGSRGQVMADGRGDRGGCPPR